MEQLSFDDLEAWKPVPRFEGLYEVSNFARVRSLYRKTPRVLRPSWSTGYGVVILCRAGAREGRTVHSLVMAAFVGPCPEGQEVRHLDGNRANSRWAPGETEDEIRANGGNLMYGTRSENIYDRVRHGTHHSAIKTHCKNGHEFTEANTRITKRGRTCRKCNSKPFRKFRRTQAA